MSTKTLTVIAGLAMVAFFASSTLHPIIATEPQSAGKGQHKGEHKPKGNKAPKQ